MPAAAAALLQVKNQYRDVYNRNAVCVDARVCTGVEYEVAPLGPKTDRACTALTACCDNATACPQWDGSAASAPAQGTALEYEATAPTKTSDRRCLPVRRACEDDEFENAPPTTTTDRTCTKCAEECKFSERGGVQRSMYHPGHFGTFLAQKCKGEAAGGGALYSDLECLECPKQQKDVVFLLDFGISMESAVGLVLHCWLSCVYCALPEPSPCSPARLGARLRAIAKFNHTKSLLTLASACVPTGRGNEGLHARCGRPHVFPQPDA